MNINYHTWTLLNYTFNNLCTENKKNKAPNLIFIPIPETTIEENIYTGNISLKYGYYYYLLLNLFFYKQHDY